MVQGLTLLEPLLPKEPIRASKTVGPLVGARAGCQLPQAVRDALTSDPACIDELDCHPGVSAVLRSRLALHTDAREASAMQVHFSRGTCIL